MGIGVLLLAVHGIRIWGGRPVVEGLGLVGADFLAGEAPWAVFTYMFVHADLVHLLGNLLVLVTVGPALEERVGERTFLVAFFAGGFAAAVAGLVLLPGSAIPMIGASGAIFSILTVFAVLYPFERVPVMLVYFVWWMPALVVLLIYLGFNLALIFDPNTGVAWWGHFAGFFTGLGLGLLADRRGARSGTGFGRRRLHLDTLRPLATGRDTKTILATLEQMQVHPTRDDAVLSEAWLERFYRKANCPRCGAALKHEEGRAACAASCGYRVDAYAPAETKA